jgi:hypothetical protein
MCVAKAEVFFSFFPNKVIIDNRGKKEVTSHSTSDWKGIGNLIVQKGTKITYWARNFILTNFTTLYLDTNLQIVILPSIVWSILHLQIYAHRKLNFFFKIKFCDIIFLAKISWIYIRKMKLSKMFPDFFWKTNKICF